MFLILDFGFLICSEQFLVTIPVNTINGPRNKCGVTLLEHHTLSVSPRTCCGV